MDSVRAKNTSLHGYGRETTPFLEKFASEATHYGQAKSPGIHSVASHASIWSGLHVEEHNVVKHESRLSSIDTVWDDLKKQGYKTGLFSPNVVLTKSSNLSQPFDKVVTYPDRFRPVKDAVSPEDYPELPSKLQYLKDIVRSGRPLGGIANGIRYKTRETNIENETGDLYANFTLDWIEKQNKPWAACINMLDAHHPYVPKEEFDNWATEQDHEVHERVSSGYLSQNLMEEENNTVFESLKSLYDGCIRQCDSIVESLVNELKRRGEYDNTLLVITSDHGEGFGETSPLESDVRLIDHSWGIAEELVHVPLMVKYPKQTNHQYIGSPSSLTQFRTVVNEVLEGKREPFIPDGLVLSSTFRLRDEQFALYDCDNIQKFGGPWRAVYASNGEVTKLASRQDHAIKIHLDGISRDFVGKIDDKEIVSVFKSHINSRKTAESNELPEDVERRLQDLGYVR